MKKYDVVALGELLIDFTENGMSAQGNPLLEANPGGAPCNVLAMLARLGHRTGFIGKVGRDMFGDQLERALKETGIGIEGLVRDPEVHTTLAFVHTFPDGDRDFSFYRKPGADMMLSVSDLNIEMIQNARIFHFGTLSMTDELCREATRAAIGLAKDAGAILTFDPNLRPPLWSTWEEAKEQTAYGISQCSMLKISDNEIFWFTGIENYESAARFLQEQYPNLELILLSLGKEGSMAFSGNRKAVVPAFLSPHTIETTGAGDSFCGCILHYLLGHNGLEGKIRDFSEEELKEMLLFANAAASIVTTRKGALRVMPSREEIEAIL